jgi:hypothetical protein
VSLKSLSLSRIQVLLRALLVALFLGNTGFAMATTLPDEDNTAYLQALNFLSTGKLDEAIERLRAIVERNTYHQGALLDLALTYCQAERTQDADLLFKKLEARADLPVAIAEVIRFYKEGACKYKASTWHAMLATGAGFANNLNQAPSSAFLYLPPLDLTLQLAEKSRPRSDSFSVLEGAVYFKPGKPAWSAGLFAQQKTFSSNPAFDSWLVQAALTHRMEAERAQIESQGIYSQQRLGGDDYLSFVNLSSSALWPIKAASADNRRSLLGGGVFAWSDLNYAKLPDYRSQQVDALGRLFYQPGSKLGVTSDLGWSYDRALANRPGGNRQGPVVQLGAQWLVSPLSTLKMTYRRAWMQDTMPYSPVFFGDAKRDNAQAAWYGAWLYQFSTNWRWRLDARYFESKDTIELFKYDTSELRVMLEWAVR